MKVDLCDHTDQRDIVPSRAELLAHYAHKTPNRFDQYDGWPQEMCDGIIQDVGGYGLTTGTTWELMAGGPAVRVLIKPGTDPQLVNENTSSRVQCML
jgi:hypothetical protein